MNSTQAALMREPLTFSAQPPRCSAIEPDILVPKQESGEVGVVALTAEWRQAGSTTGRTLGLAAAGGSVAVRRRTIGQEAYAEEGQPNGLVIPASHTSARGLVLVTIVLHLVHHALCTWPTNQKLVTLF